MSKKIIHTNLFKQLVVLFILAFALSACSLLQKPTKQTPKPVPAPNQNNNQPEQKSVSVSIADQLKNQSKIKKFSSHDELKQFLEENSSEGGLGYSGGLRDGMMLKSMTIPAMQEPSLGFDFAEELSLDSVDNTGGSSDYSTTNIQVEGVDEADIVKTDGEYIYTVSNNNLFIVDGHPAKDAKVISKIEFDSVPKNIYIKGDSLIVYGNNNRLYEEKYSKILPPQRRSSYTFFKVFDVSDKKSPKQIRDLDFEGNYINSRMIGDYVYFVTTKYSYGYIDDDMPLPIILEDGEMMSTDALSARCNCPDIYYFDMPYQDTNFTSIAVINITDNDQKISNESYLLNSNQNMYVSEKNIYITYTKYVSEDVLAMEVIRELVIPRLDKKNQDKIAKIELVDNFILSKEEKLNKISNIVQQFIVSLDTEEQGKLKTELEEKMKQKYQDISKELEKTVIHKIAINKENLEYQTFGEVTGVVLNQFSMDESGDYFRIATTKNRSWSRFEDNGTQESYNNLYVLDKDLKVVGSLEDLAKGERIYSVRFMQGRAYMVTFKQTDPLFVIDLSIPTSPKVLGELKIPGFSNYLHPYDNDTLIGLGRDTDVNEWGGVVQKGIKLSLFDVSNVASPKEIDTYIIGDRYSSSIALNDHKAFLFSKDKNLLVIPVTKNENFLFEEDIAIDCLDIEDCIVPRRVPAPKRQFRGAVVFDIDKSGFELKGEIEHSADNYYDYNAIVKRSLYIDDVLYTLSNKYLKMNQLVDLSLVKNLELAKNIGDDDDFKIIN